MSTAQRTTDHAKIRRWAEERKGKPALVHDADDVALLRIDFRETTDNEDELEEITWDEFFVNFDAQRLAFVYHDRTASGARSRINTFVSR